MRFDLNTWKVLDQGRLRTTETDAVASCEDRTAWRQLISSTSREKKKKVLDDVTSMLFQFLTYKSAPPFPVFPHNIGGFLRSGSAAIRGARRKPVPERDPMWLQQQRVGNGQVACTDKIWRTSAVTFARRCPCRPASWTTNDVDRRPT